MKHTQVTSYIMVKKGMFSPKIRNRARMSALTLLLNIVWEVLVREIRQEKEIHSIHIVKEELKVPMITDDLILYIENPRVPTNKLL